MSDSDVCVEPSYLNDIARVLPDPKVGAATVLFRSSIDGSFVSRLEAISAGLDFWASTLLARHVEGGLRFTHGATMVIGRKLLQEMGGWETRVNHSEDDAWLGEQTANRGRAVAIVGQPVWMVYPTRTFREYLSHEVLRYVRIRTTRPLAYVGFVFTHGLPFVVIAALLALSTPWKVADLTVYFLLRSLMVWEVGVGVLDDPVIRRWWWLAPVRDVLGFCVWLAAFGTNRIVWRGHKFRSLPGGKLEPVDPGAGVKKRNPDAQAHLHQGS